MPSPGRPEPYAFLRVPAWHRAPTAGAQVEIALPARGRGSPCETTVSADFVASRGPIGGNGAASDGRSSPGPPVSLLVFPSICFALRVSLMSATGRRLALRLFFALRLGFRARGVRRAAPDPPSSTCQVNLAGQPRRTLKGLRRAAATGSRDEERDLEAGDRRAGVGERSRRSGRGRRARRGWMTAAEAGAVGLGGSGGSSGSGVLGLGSSGSAVSGLVHSW
jgi:hypothetical protein